MPTSRRRAARDSEDFGKAEAAADLNQAGRAKRSPRGHWPGPAGRARWPRHCCSRPWPPRHASVGGAAPQRPMSGSRAHRSRGRAPGCNSLGRRAATASTASAARRCATEPGMKQDARRVQHRAQIGPVSRQDLLRPPREAGRVDSDRSPMHELATRFLERPANRLQSGLATRVASPSANTGWPSTEFTGGKRRNEASSTSTIPVQVETSSRCNMSDWSEES